MAATDGGRTLYGPRGWTVERGVLGLVAPAVDAAASMPPDFLRFAGLGAAQAGRLWDVVPADNLLDRQNDAPSCGSLLRACAQNPGRVELLGYVVGPGRDDERLSLEGFVCHGSAPARPAATGADWEELRRALRLGSCAPPDEFRVVAARSRPGAWAWRAWWD